MTLLRATFGKRAYRMALLPLMMSAPAQRAVAQIIDDDPIVVPQRPARPSQVRSAFSRDWDVAVLDRALPEFSAHGFAVGPFDLFPALDIAPEYTSNVFANNQRKHSAATVVARPEAVLRTRGGPIDLDLYGRGRFARVAGYSSENTEEEIGGIDLGSDIGPLSRLSAGASIGNRVLPRYAPDSPTNAAKPLEYQEVDGNVEASVERGRFRVIARGDLTRLRFRDAPSLDGGTILTGDRDRLDTSGQVRLEYAVKPNTSFYVALTGNRIDYRLKPPEVAVQRDSSGYGAYIGSSFELSSLMRGDLRVGYIRQTFDLAGIKPISGIGFKGSLQYFPTRRLTLTARGERSVEDSGVPGTAGLIHAGGELQADQELRRYLILSIIGGHFTDNYRGLFRHDHDSYAGITGTYLSKNHWNARIGYQYNRRNSTSTDSGADFDDHRLLASLTFQI